MWRVQRNGIKGARGGAMIALALLAAAGAADAETGAAPAETLVCEAAPGNTPDAASHVARVSDPFGEAPELTGASGPLPVRLFRRQRTLIFDAVSEALYLDSESYSFSYTRWAPDGVTIWRGKCRVED